MPSVTLELMRPILFQRSITGAPTARNFGFATPMSDGSRLPAALRPKMYPHEAGEERVHVVRVAVALLNGDADLSLELLLRRERLRLEARPRLRHLRELRVRDERDVLDVERSAVEALHRDAVGEGVSAPCGMLARAAFEGLSGTIDPFDDSSPTQSCAPTMRSGAVSAWTVLTSARMLSLPFWTMSRVTSFVAAQSLATLVIAVQAIRVYPDADRRGVACAHSR